MALSRWVYKKSLVAKPTPQASTTALGKKSKNIFHKLLRRQIEIKMPL